MVVLLGVQVIVSQLLVLSPVCATQEFEPRAGPIRVGHVVVV